MTAAPEVITFGCRLNTYESDIMRKNALAAGLTDTVIVNTCAVTAEAERQARQSIRRLRRERPDARIIVTGCASQIGPESFTAMPEVDHIIANDRKLEPAVFEDLEFRRSENGGTPPPSWGRLGGGEFNKKPNWADVAVPPSPNPSPQGGGAYHRSSFKKDSQKPAEGQLQRAFVQVQNGCDHRCTFCIIPFGRGKSRSMPIGAIAEETRARVAEGYNEVVFTGVDIASYGSDLPGQPRLGQMIRRVLALVPELRRLRLSSLDPAAIDEDLWRLIENEPRLMPHLHLSLQAGDDMILKRMKRRHSRGDVIALVERARRVQPDIVFGADIIAGFPTEDEEMFANTYNLVEQCGLTWLHVFPYSARKGTPAAKMPQVHGSLRKERAERLRALGTRAAQCHADGLIGKSIEVLVEQQGVGCTPHFAKIKLEGDAPVGDLVMAACIAREDDQAVARVA